MRPWLLALTLCWLLGASHPASADTRSISYSVWNVIGQSVYLRFTVPTAQARYLAEPGEPAPTTEAIARYLASHVSVSSAAGPCPAIDQGEEIGLVFTLSLSPGQHRFEMVFQCPQQKGMVLENTFLFDRVPQHINFARIQVDGGGFVSQVFDSASERIMLPSTPAALSDAGIFYYVQLGARHITYGLDRLCFVLALLLARYRRRDLGYLICGLSLGYVFSLAISLTGVITPRMELTEPLIGFMIVLVTAEAASRVIRRPWAVAGLIGGGLLVLSAAALLVRGPSLSLMLAGLAAFAACYLPISNRLAERAAFGLVPTLLFGTLDGFGFAADLSMLKLPAGALAQMHLGFDAGAVLVVALVASAIVAGTWLARERRIRGAWPTLVDIGAALLAGLGVFWFIGRLAVT
jgi:HupE / UreJ protein